MLHWKRQTDRQTEKKHLKCPPGIIDLKYVSPLLVDSGKEKSFVKSSRNPFLNYFMYFIKKTLRNMDNFE